MDQIREVLCLLLNRSMNGENLREAEVVLLKQVNMDRVVALADTNRVLQYLYDPLMLRDEDELLITKGQQMQLQNAANKSVMQSYRLLFESQKLVGIAKELGLSVAVLKGCGIASYYPVFEYRRSGDIDLCFASMADAKKMLEELCKRGYEQKDMQHGLHHLVCVGSLGIEIEIHSVIVEEFESNRVNQELDRLTKRLVMNAKEIELCGASLPIPQKEDQALQLLLHMLHHFLREGMGIRLLCDWVVFWNKEGETAALRFMEDAELLGLTGFAKAITKVCEKYLGLMTGKLYSKTGKAEYDDSYLENLLDEIFDAGEFGQQDLERMVAPKRSGIVGMIGEFHHQMKLNHPKYGEIIVLWPVLWVKTLVVYFYNNHKLGRTSAVTMIKKANERARLVERLKLYKS